MMSRLLSVLALLAFSGTVFAASESAPASDKASAKTAQQEKMASCNKEATGKKGEERKAFMKQCLSAKPSASDTQMTQQDKMKECNAQAKGKKGEEHKAFMKSCLSSNKTDSKADTKADSKPESKTDSKTTQGK